MMLEINSLEYENIYIEQSTLTVIVDPAVRQYLRSRDTRSGGYFAKHDFCIDADQTFSLISTTMDFGMLFH